MTTPYAHGKGTSKYTAAQIAKTRALWSAGLSTRLIAIEMGWTKNVVVSLAHRQGFPARQSPIASKTAPLTGKTAKRIWTPNEDALLHARRVAGHSWDQIAAELGVSRFCVIERGRKIGAPLSPVIAASNPPQPDGAVDVRLPMPAGSAVSWGAISDQPWPGDLL